MRTKPIALHTLSMNEFEWSLRYKKMAQYIDNTLRSNQTNITLTHLTYLSSNNHFLFKNEYVFS